MATRESKEPQLLGAFGGTVGGDGGSEVPPIQGLGECNLEVNILGRPQAFELLERSLDPRVAFKAQGNRIQFRGLEQLPYVGDRNTDCRQSSRRQPNGPRCTSSGRNCPL